MPDLSIDIDFADKYIVGENNVLCISVYRSRNKHPVLYR